MTAEEFTSTAVAHLRTAVGWQSAIARRLNVDSRTVRRWLQEGVTPSWVDKKMAHMVGLGAGSPWPRDEWVIGDAVMRGRPSREYIVHIVPPRFVARIVMCDEDGTALREEEPADLLTAPIYNAGPTTVLCEVEWFDDVSAGEVVQLLDAAADAIDASTESDPG